MRLTEGLYIHIPYCKKRCLYCAFYSCGIVQARWDDYMLALRNELATHLHNPSIPQSPEKLSQSHNPDHSCVSPNTLYIGGGTPSLIPPADFLNLMKILRQEGISLAKLKEFTLEVNPEDVSEELAYLWHQSGVNRISMGVQSFVDSELKAIGRRHSASEAMKAYKILSERFSNISLDLMFGLPGQTLDSLCQSIEEIIRLNPSHVSLYSLQYEERTALTHLRDRGDLEETSDDITVAMFQTASRMLTEAGYEQYEISNYAKPGARSIHNSAYWQGKSYIGLGPSAHSYDGKRLRRGNTPDIKRYINYYLNRQATEPPYIEESLTDEELLDEYVMTRMRTREGISKTETIQKFGPDNWYRILKNASRYIISGHIKEHTEGISLSSSGIMNSDTIILDLIM